MRPISLALVPLLLAGCTGAMAPWRGPSAVAEMRDAKGQAVGRATFAQADDQVRIVLRVHGLPPGDKGVHLHAVGQCAGPAFTSAGGHFNPTGAQHGTLNPRGPHAGDLPNIAIGGDGTGRLDTTTARVTLGAGPTSLFDTDGSALVIHAGPDDYRTDPTGGSGARIACGVIVKR